MSKIKFRIAAFTDPAGKLNESAPKRGNEDDLFVDSDLTDLVRGQFIADKVVQLGDAGCLMAVADGMGGMNAGEVASAIAIETVKASFENERLTEAIWASHQSRAKYLEKVVVDADAAIKKRSRADKECEGMGSTLIMAWLCGSELTITWCGDSRAYLFRDSDGIRQISKDHSYVQGLVDSGAITEVQAFDHPYGNIVTKSLGDPDRKAEPDSVTINVSKGDIILLCSDGLSGVLRDRKSYDEDGTLIPGDNLEDIIRSNRQTMSECREALWGAAEKADWYDNVTAILCEIVDGDEDLAKVAPAEGVAKSFINIRISKKCVGAMSVIVGVILTCILGIGAYYYFHERPLSQKKVFIESKDSLLRVSDSLHLTFISGKIRALPDSVDMEALTKIGTELACRKDSLLLLESLIVKADSLGITRVKDTLDEMKRSVLEDDVPNYHISEAERNIHEICVLLQKLDSFLKIERNLVNINKIRGLKDGLIKKGCVEEKDYAEWESISIEKTTNLNPKSRPESNPTSEQPSIQTVQNPVPEKVENDCEPKLTPVADESGTLTEVSN